MERMNVKANGHGPVPMEENSTRYISDEPVSVPQSAYYLRRVMQGELIEIADPKPAKLGKEK